MTYVPFDLESAADPTTPIADPDGTWEHNPNIVAEGVDMLIDLFRKPRSVGELTAHLTQVQELEDALWGLKDAFSLASAIGVQLDMRGALYGESRLGRTDEDYRASIRAAILARKSNGKAEQLITIARELSPTDTEILLFDAYMGNTLQIVRSGQTDASGQTFYRLLQLAHQAATKLNVVLHDEGGEELRMGAEDGALTGDLDMGAEDDASVGGTLGYDATL